MRRKWWGVRRAPRRFRAWSDRREVKWRDYPEAKVRKNPEENVRKSPVSDCQNPRDDPIIVTVEVGIVEMSP